MQNVLGCESAMVCVMLHFMLIRRNAEMRFSKMSAPSVLAAEHRTFVNGGAIYDAIYSSMLAADGHIQSTPELG